MTARQDADKAEAMTKLRNWVKPGDTVYTVLDRVSASGMTRHIRVVLLETNRKGECVDLHPNWAVGTVLGLRHAKRNGYETDALVVGGAGMDMGFHVVNSLSYTLYPKYQCVGRNRCPSADHVNSGPNRDKYGKRITHDDGYALKHRWL